MNCRIVQNLVFDFVLGWDFFHKYDAKLHARDGLLTFQNQQIKLIENTTYVSRTHFAYSEDVVVPPFSKVHTPATFLIDPQVGVRITDTVIVEPLYGQQQQISRPT